MNAVDLLKSDHEKIATLFDQAETEQNNEQKRNLFEQIATEFEMHTYVEETVFYPAVRELEDQIESVLDAFQEHVRARAIISDARDAEDRGRFADLLTLLRRQIEAHVEEEERELFPRAERAIDPQRLDEMGAKMEKIKQEYGRLRFTSPAEGHR